MNHILSIQSRIVDEAPPSSPCRSMLHRVMKIVLMIMSFAAVYPGLEASRRNFNHSVIAEIGAYSEGFVAGLVACWFTREVYESMFETTEISENTNCCRVSTIVYWMSIVFFALSTQIPTAYNSYVYNEGSLFWSCYTPLFFSAFLINSLHGSFQKVYRSNNRFTRRIIGARRVEISSQQNIHDKIFRNSVKALTNSPNAHFSNLISVANEGKSYQFVRDLFRHLSRIGINRKLLARMRKEQHPFLIRKIRGGVKIISSLTSLSSPVLDSILTISAVRLISNEIWPLPFVILIAVGPGVYLQVKLSQKFWVKTYTNVFRAIRSCVRERGLMGCFPRGCEHVAYTTFKVSLLALATLLGTFSFITVVRDNIGFNNPLNSTLSCGAIGTLTVITLTALRGLWSGVEHSINKRKRSNQEIRYDDLMGTIELMGAFLKNMPQEEYVRFMKYLDIERTALSDDVFSNPELAIRLIASPAENEQIQSDESSQIGENPVLEEDHLLRGGVLHGS